MRRNIAIAFLISQLLGELFVWMAPHRTGPEGPWLWVASVVLLLPGNLIASWIIEKFFWTSGLSSSQLQLLEVLFEVPINAAVWTAIALPWIRPGTRFGRRNAENAGG